MKWHVWPAPALAVEAITALLTAQVQAGVPVIAFSATDAHGARVAGPEPVVAVAA